MNLDQFISRAAGHGPCVGVHREMPSPLAAPASVEVRTVDGALVKTLGGLYDAFAEVWHFPPWFGRNANAFNDFMRDLDNMVQTATGRQQPARGYVTDVTNAHLLLIEQPEAFSWFANKMAFYRDYYRDELSPPAAFGLLLSAPADKRHDVRERWMSVGIQVAEVDV
jgi:hypothetical protein